MNKAKELVVPRDVTSTQQTRPFIKEFLSVFPTEEMKNQVPHLLHRDEKNGALYIQCHLDAKTLATKTDVEAVLDSQESEDYKLNREIYTDTHAYEVMLKDALRGRGFEDLVIEYDTSYRPQTPLKVFGGQHRVSAIGEALKKNVAVTHGVRVYFNLTIDQRFDIALANNTSIAVPNDLLDRMQEELLGADLRDWCQEAGLLREGQNFADRRNAEGVLTVRVARTLVANFHAGRSNPDADEAKLLVCGSGPGIDPTYNVVRGEIDWSDSNLKDMGARFARLHWKQRDAVLNRDEHTYLEFANKAIHPCVTASWAYAAGVLQTSGEYLEKHYALAESVSPPQDPLNALALSRARMKPTDPDTYRGLGARMSGDELGRMFEVFLLHATRVTRPGISGRLPNAAIQSYEAKKAKRKAERALRGI